MSYTIKHMGLGGILDQAIAIIRDNFVLLLSIVAIVIVPLSLVQNFLVYYATPELPSQPTADDYRRVWEAQARYMPWMNGYNVLYMLVLLPIANAAVIQAVARRYLGQAVT